VFQSYLNIIFYLVFQTHISNINVTYINVIYLFASKNIFIFYIADAIASAENVRVAPSLRSQKGLCTDIT